MKKQTSHPIPPESPHHLTDEDRYQREVGVAEATDYEATPDYDGEEAILTAFAQLVLVETLLLWAWQAEARHDRALDPFSERSVPEAAYRVMRESLATFRQIDILDAVVKTRPHDDRQARTEGGMA